MRLSGRVPGMPKAHQQRVSVRHKRIVHAATWGPELMIAGRHDRFPRVMGRYFDMSFHRLSIIESLRGVRSDRTEVN